MTRVPNIGAEYLYQKTGTINRHKNGACPIRYQKLYQKNSVPNSRQMHQKLVPFFWHQFLVSVSWAQACGILRWLPVSFWEHINHFAACDERNSSHSTHHVCVWRVTLVILSCELAYPTHTPLHYWRILHCSNCIVKYTELILHFRWHWSRQLHWPEYKQYWKWWWNVTISCCSW